MRTALIIVDPQNDFCAGGALAVGGGDQVMKVINELRYKIKPNLVAITQDWHPGTHTSFADNNPKETLFQPRKDGQMMWPRHCVQHTRGAEFHSELRVLPTDYIIQKGTNKDVDSYSGFGAEDKAKERTELETILRAAKIDLVYVVGLAFDYCVAATAKDAVAAGFPAIVIRNATRAVARESAAAAEMDMRGKHVIILDEHDEEAATRLLEATMVTYLKLLADLRERSICLADLRAKKPWWKRLLCYST